MGYGQIQEEYDLEQKFLETVAKREIELKKKYVDSPEKMTQKELEELNWCRNTQWKENTRLEKQYKQRMKEAKRKY